MFATSTRVALVEPDQTVASHIQPCLASQPDFVLVGTSNNFNHFQQNVNLWVPDIVIMSMVYMPQIAPLRRVQVRPALIVLLPQSVPLSQVITALQDGAHGYLRADDPCDIINQRIREISRQRSFLDPPVIQDLAQCVQQNALSVRPIEQQILDALAQHGSISQAAQQSPFDEDTLLQGLFSIISTLHQHP
jgi:DNA-binding NarL/FixJ family response regulator